MSKPVRIYLLGGLGGLTWPFYYSWGLKTLAAKAEALSKDVSTLVLDYGEASIQRVVQDAQYAVARSGAQIVLVGHSLGVRDIVEAARRLAEKGVYAALIVGFDGTWNSPPGPVVGDIPAIEFYNTTWQSFLGHAKMYRADGSERGIKNIPKPVLHQNIDDDVSAQLTALDAIKGLLA